MVKMHAPFSAFLVKVAKICVATIGDAFFVRFRLGRTFLFDFKLGELDMNVGIIIVIIIACILAAALTVLLIIDYKNKKIVLDKSERVRSLIALNATTHFDSTDPSYSYHQPCTSKMSLEHLDIEDYLIDLIDQNESFFSNIIQVISSNITTYSNYMSRAQAITSTATEDFCKSFGFSLEKFLWYEERIFKSKTLREPQIDVVIHCKATYTSPQGRNHYCKEESYHYVDLKRVFEHTMELKAQRQTRQYHIKVERAKMTDSLRYDILKRDNFRCQICGSTQHDGVKLHVDHIIPVSKGGLTVESNLRTLCDRCNMGKSDKI